jgi:hypothetical protein
VLAGIPAALTWPAAPEDVPPDAGAPACAPDVAPATAEPPLGEGDPALPFPEEFALSELEQAIAKGSNARMRPYPRNVRRWPGCMIFFSLGSMNSGPESADARRIPHTTRTLSNTGAAQERAILAPQVGSKFPLRLRIRAGTGAALRTGAVA